MAKEPKDAAAAPGGAPAAAAAAKSSKRKKEFRKKKEKRVVPHGVVCIQATFNNTIVTLTDPDGRAVSWSSAGSVGFKGSRKGTPYAAQQAAATAAGPRCPGMRWRRRAASPPACPGCRYRRRTARWPSTGRSTTRRARSMAGAIS